MRLALACLTNVFLMTFKYLRSQLSSNIDETYLCMPHKMTNFNYELFKVIKMTNFNYELLKVLLCVCFFYG